jgi:hypothetical protein
METKKKSDLKVEESLLGTGRGKRVEGGWT